MLCSVVVIVELVCPPNQNCEGQLAPGTADPLVQQLRDSGNLLLLQKQLGEATCWWFDSIDHLKNCHERDPSASIIYYLQAAARLLRPLIYC